MNRENAIVYIVNSPDLNNTFDELKNAFGVERAININRDLYIKTYSKISSYDNAVIFITYSKTKKNYDLRWMSMNEPGFLDTAGKNYHQSFIVDVELAFKTGAKRVLWISHLCPLITSDDINFAFSSITDKNVVLGPAKNKGLYLVGFAKEGLKIFDNFYLLRENLKDELIEKIKKNRFSFVEMEEKFLVKDDESLKNWVESKEYLPQINKNIETTISKEEKHHKKKSKDNDNGISDAQTIH